MKVLVTGATGFIGFHVAKLLTEKGFSVNALVRDGYDAALGKLGVEPVKGDIRDYEACDRAMKGCSQVYHLAADYRLWVLDPAPMYAVNVRGTKNIMRAAFKRSVEKVVYTSTVGVLAARGDGTPSNEESAATFRDMVGHYKKSKFLAENEVRHSIEQGLPVVIVNPSTPVGSFDRKPTPTGKIIVDFVNGRIPAYVDTGLNFVDVEDVAAGHVEAARSGRVGQRYILGNRNMTLRDFFAVLARMTGRTRRLIRLPYAPVLAASYVNEALSRITGKPPAIPLTGVKMAGTYMFFDCTKAVSELRLPQSPIEGALEKALQWFERNDYIEERAS
jgi:dihydroflavonol-4-reductase